MSKYTRVQVDKETRNKIQALKYKLGLRSANEVIKLLLERCGEKL